MEEDKNKKYVKKNSSVSKNSRKKNTNKSVVKSAVLNNDELLDEILSKSKAKKAVAKAKRAARKIEPTTLSNDELFDQIMAKKALKKKKVAPAKEVKSILTSDFVSNSIEISDNISGSEKTKEIISPVIEETVETDIFSDSVNDEQHIVDNCCEDVESTDFVDKVVKSKKKVSNALIFFLISVVFLLIVGISAMLLYEPVESVNIEIPVRDEYFDSKPLQYQECLKREFGEFNNTIKIQEGIIELNSYIKSKYKASISYEDLNSGFTYSYNSDKVYYAASTIKALDGLYIYTKAAAGEINLDDKMIYNSKYKRAYSAGMAKHKIGEAVSLRNLVKYAITVSDNTAHEMLVEYIGKRELREFGLSLGATFTLYGGDNFGSISSADALIYAKSLNKFIIENGVFGLELQEYLINAAQNGLKIESKNILAGHKYGEYDIYYHDYGIVYDTYPYVVAIMTTEGYSGDFQAVIKDINYKVYELHNLFHKNREEICFNEIYGN